MKPIYGFQGVAIHAGVSQTTAYRDYLAGVLKVDEWVSGRRNKPLACFHQPTASSCVARPLERP